MTHPALPTHPRVINADPGVARQRLAAIDYATLQPNTPLKAIPMPEGGELHMPDGSIFPVAPGDWVAENPDGTVRSVSFDEIGEHWKFVKGSPEQEQAFQTSVKQFENIQRGPVPDNPVLLQTTELTPGLHPDGFERAAERDLADGQPKAETAEERAALKDVLQAQVSRAHDRLVALANVAVDRGLINSDEAKTWIHTGVAPQGVHVSRDELTDTLQVERAPTNGTPVDAGDSHEDGEGTTKTDGHVELEELKMPELWKRVEDPKTVKGTGTDGAVKKSDLVAHIERQ